MYRETFLKIWNEFQESDEVPVYDPLHTGFSRGRKSDLAFAVRLTPEQIPAGTRQIVEQLEGFSELLLFPEEYYHISVKLVGFLADLRMELDDIAMNEIDAICHQARPILERAIPFSVALGPPNVLGSFIVLEADDAGYIPSLQAAFREEAALIPDYRLEGAQWLPHLSIGGFRVPHLSRELKSYLNSLRDKVGGIVDVTEIDLIQAELQEPFPHLRTVETYSLRADDE